MSKRDPAPSYVPNDAYTQADWDAVSDTPPLTDAELGRARPGVEGMPPAMAEAFTKRAGRPKVERRSVPVSLRVPAEVLDAYKAGGPGWQTRMNAALAAGLATHTQRDPRSDRNRAVHDGTQAPSAERRAIKRTA